MKSNSSLLRTLTDRTLGSNGVDGGASSGVYGTATVLPKDKTEALAAIDYLENLQDDWNGFGAKAPSAMSLEYARVLIEKIPPKYFYPQKISPDGEGGVTLMWNTGSERLIATVDVNLIHLSRTGRAGASDVFKDDIIFDGEFLPECLKAQLPLRFKN